MKSFYFKKVKIRTTALTGIFFNALQFVITTMYNAMALELLGSGEPGPDSRYLP
jgi:hypothetical protein